jgi:geranylgeranyl diphosphate synthase type II
VSASDFLKQRAALVEAALRDETAGWEGAPPGLVRAAEYSLFAGGKRLRPALALGAAEIVCAMPAACALEMIHTYSLIHDDLPAMDDDALRRGRPTCHIKFGEASAILAGDALLTMAFDALAKCGRAKAIAELAQAAGAAGMVGGQYIDLASENKQIGLDALRGLHARKTGALIRSAVRLGAMLADAASEQLAALTAYGEHIGLAFQIADDILDVEGDATALGKPVGSDEAHHKSTYPALVGLERARELAADAVEAAIAALHPFGAEADEFRTLAHYIVDRDC